MLVIAALLATGPALAQQQVETVPRPSPEAPSAPDMIREGARRILDGIRRLVEQMPMFEPPRITPEGDIILKRIKPLYPEAEDARSEPSREGLEL
ncbi:MAG: hypothetical protein FJX60_10045 [Alphaproteobacteria bacterium]|nr:hypothetical protein [Alphaproteobacteria bacterium]